MKEHERNLKNGPISPDFIYAYLGKMDEERNKPLSNFEYVHLETSALSLFTGGSNPTFVSIHWHLLNIANNPDTLQSELQREIDEVIGRDRVPRWDDHKRMPFTMATIWEMHRWRTNNPLGIPREANKDLHIRGYLVPKGTAVIPNMWAVYMDPRLWKEPQMFDPTRFLSEEPRQLVAKPPQLLPFSIGKRKCPGESMATVETFIFLTSLLHKFHILPEEGKTINMKPKTIFFCTPVPQKLRFIPREE